MHKKIKWYSTLALSLSFYPLPQSTAYAGRLPELLEQPIAEAILQGLDPLTVLEAIEAGHGKVNQTYLQELLDSFNSNFDEVFSSKQEVERYLDDTNWEKLIPYFLESIRQHDLKTLDELIKQQQDFDPNRIFVAAFLAKQAVDMNHAWNSAYDAAFFASPSVLRAAGLDDALVLDEVRAAAQGAAWIAAGNAAWEAAKSAGLFDIWLATWSRAKKPFRDSTENITFELIKALETLKLTRPAQFGERAYAISELLALNRLRRENYKPFKEAYDEADQLLNEYLTIEQIEVAGKSIEEFIRNLELPQTPFIIDLKLYVEDVKKLVGKSK